MLDIHLENRDSFVVWGYGVETDLANNDKDIGRLWSDRKDELQTLSANPSGLYGVMWYTDNTHKRYCYVLAVQANNQGGERINNQMKQIEIPKGLYAVARFPDSTDLGEAWSEFYFKELPMRGLETDYQHGIFFEWYPVEGGIELWNPVNKIE